MVLSNSTSEETLEVCQRWLEAEIISQASDISVIIFKKRVKNSQCALTTGVSKDGKSAPGTGMKTALQPMEKTTLEQITIM